MKVHRFFSPGSSISSSGMQECLATSSNSAWTVLVKADSRLSKPTELTTSTCLKGTVCPKSAKMLQDTQDINSTKAWWMVNSPMMMTTEWITNLLQATPKRKPWPKVDLPRLESTQVVSPQDLTLAKTLDSRRIRAKPSTSHLIWLVPSYKASKWCLEQTRSWFQRRKQVCLNWVPQVNSKTQWAAMAKS